MAEEGKEGEEEEERAGSRKEWERRGGGGEKILGEFIYLSPPI